MRVQLHKGPITHLSLSFASSFTTKICLDVSLVFFITIYLSHLFNIYVRFPCFGEERRPGGEVLLKLGLGVLLTAVAAAGGAAPGHLEGRSFFRAASGVSHPDY